MRRGFLLNGNGAKTKPTRAVPKPSPTVKDAPSIPEHPTSIILPHSDCASLPPRLLTQAELHEDFLQRLKADRTFSFNLTQIPPTYAHALDQRSLVLCYPGVKDAVLARGVRPMQATLRDWMFTISDVPGAGKGVFAAAAFPRGARVMCERPLFVLPTYIPVNVGERVGPRGMPKRISDVVVGAMEDTARTAFFELHNCKSDDPRDFQGILDTNSLSVGALPGYNGDNAAVFKNLSRVNHSCSPNAFYRWNEDYFCGEIRAARPIAEREEITISYHADVLDKRDQRQHILKANYAFTCACQACRIPVEERKRSDVRRGVLATVNTNAQKHDSDFAAWATDPTAPDDYIVQKYLRYAKMMDEEGLNEPAQWAIISHALAQAYCALKDATNAQMWLESLAEYTMVRNGTGSVWTELAKVPEKLEWWGVRVSSAPKLGSV
ncbi:SET domain-containing protein [Artomyces pyxidatus]|uniref:SET domain-containing protein n=1 Tax=Artomyces pyxidatus TaxID=48021 RepID=A0ACB8T2R1_9AGAM|nr:SET domain-containing protein [Artomyces pyxidatus]